MFDTLITDALVYSGLNEPPSQTHVAITGDRIEAIGKHLSPAGAKKHVDGSGLYLTPGFIDPHASTGFGYFFDRAADHKLFQGITTEIFGNCGTSPGPIGPELVPTMEKLSSDIGFPFEWRSLAEYFDKIKDNLQFNIATLIGHSTLRGGYLKDWHHLAEGDMDAMKKALSEAMDEGSLGFSTGLIYAPGCFGTTEEIIELAKVAKAKGGLYASHIRDERNEIETAVDEALHIGKEANINVLISHLKAAEQQNWGKIPGIIRKIERFNQEQDIEVAVDVYPYTAISTKLRAFIPKYLLEDGVELLPKKLSAASAVADIKQYVKERNYALDQMLIISKDIPEYESKSVAQAASDMSKSEADVIIDVLKANPETWIVYHCISEDDMDYAITWKGAMVCTDSWSYPINAPEILGRPHPRSYGAFTEFLQRYVLQKQLLSWQEAIYKVTHLPARFFNIKQRGLIREGYFADLVLLDPKNVRANATFDDPMQLSDGVVHLWVNGQHTIANKQIQDLSAGHILTLNNPETVLVECTPEDYEDIATVYNEHIAKKQSTMETTPINAHKVAQWVDAFHEKEKLFVLKREAENIGWAIIKRYSDREGYRLSCETAVYLKSKETGKGYGSQVKKELIEYCRELGYHHLVAKIFATNTASIVYNEKLGYEIVGRQKEIGYRDGKWVDVVIMQYIMK